MGACAAGGLGAGSLVRLGRPFTELSTAALFAAATSHEAWHELVHDHGISWDDAEDWLVEALGKAILGT